MKQLGVLSLPPPLRNLEGMQDPQQGTQTKHEVREHYPPPTQTQPGWGARSLNRVPKHEVTRNTLPAWNASLSQDTET